MSKITRETMLVFASSAGSNQLEQFGSLAAGSPNYVSPGGAAVSTIQSLSAWLEGWYGGIVGSNLPTIQDLNAILYVYAYQLAYIFQSGVPEWDTATVYYTGSFVSSAGVLYISQTDNNTGNAVSDPTHWLAYNVNLGPGFSLNKGAAIFNTAGTFSWTAPTGVKRIIVVSCGGGGGGAPGGLDGGESLFNGVAVGPGAAGSNSSTGGNTSTPTGSSDIYPGGSSGADGSASPFFSGGAGAGTGGSGGAASDYGPGGAGGSNPPASTSYGAGGGGGSTNEGGGAGCKRYTVVFDNIIPGNAYAVIVGAGGGGTSGHGMNGIIKIYW